MKKSKIKYDHSKLRGLIRQYLGTQREYANKLGISYPTAVSRLSGKSYFTQEEIEKTAKLFNLNAEETIEVFLTRKE